MMRAWLEARLGVGKGLAACDRMLAGEQSWGKTLGLVLMYLFALQVVVGTYLALYYSPSVSNAWASVAYVQDQVAGGWFLRGLHHHAMNAMVVVLALHGLHVAWKASYRAPGEIAWWSGLVTVPLILGFGLTGYFLTFDQNAYWAAQVRMGVAEGVPGGGLMNQVLVGGVELGNLSVVRAYVLHVLLLPAAVVGLTVLHVWAIMRARALRAGQVEPPPQWSYYPGQALRDLLAIATLAAILVSATLVTHGSPLWAPADPNSTFVARPEWFFLPLYQLLHVLPGQWQVVGSAILPAGLAVLAGLLPWLDRQRQEDQRSAARWVKAGMIVVMASATGLAGLAVRDDANDPEFAKAIVVQHDAAQSARHWAKEGVLPEGGVAVFRNDPDFRALELYHQHCATCHRLGEQGGEEAPILDGIGQRQWLADLIRNPRDPRFFGLTKHEGMDPYPEKDLNPADLTALVEYVVSLRQEATSPFDATLAKRGRSVFVDQGCEDCHEVSAGASSDGPTLYGHASRVFFARVIAEPGAEDLYGDAAEMPAFAKKLAPEDIALLADYIARQREGEGKVAIETILVSLDAFRSQVAQAQKKPDDTGTDSTATSK